MKQLILTLFVLTTLYFILNTPSVFASLKLNEIYPAPSSGEYEWIELYNDENQTIDISQYQLLDLAGNKIKISTQSALPFGFVLATSSSVLNNTGDTISFKNNLGEIIEIATYSAGFDSTKIYTKCPNGNGSWFVLNTLTKNSSNEIACQILTPTPTLEPTLTIVPTEGSGNPTPTEIVSTPTTYPLQPTHFSYDNIYLSEAMVNPMTGEKEWVEIYNNNDFAVSLKDWYVDDPENSGSTPKIFSLEVGKKSYAVFDLSSSMFNNDGDSIRLLDSKKTLKDDLEYQETEQGKTLGRTYFDSDNFCLQEPSKNSANNPCINQTPTLIMSAKTEQKDMSSTINKTPIIPISKANNFDVSIHRTINYPTGVALKKYDNGNVLGITSTPTRNNSLINLLTILSVSYSLLTISSILFKMKLSYGKDKNFYSSTLHSP